MPLPLGRLIAAVVLLIVSPLITALAIAVRLSSHGPAIHRARRVGQNGEFTLLKLRTMRVGAAALGTGVTAAHDTRVTPIGRLLRRTKLDELPQLWNVLRGDMALVGPRPEDPRYVDRNDPLHRVVFSAPPGITGPTALAYRDEEKVLAAAALEMARADGRDVATDADLERAYRDVVLPAKLAIDAEYLRTRSTCGDLAILARTIGHLLPRNPSSLDSR
jgi:lipopolysaccharide/colanic/teichoic acid biosynthesis glycosyltransferase